MQKCRNCSCFFFNDTATTEIYTLSLHDALPISGDEYPEHGAQHVERQYRRYPDGSSPSRKSARAIHGYAKQNVRSEEHTSELQSRQYLVCRLLLEKKKLYHPLLLLDHGPGVEVP